jgi:hypothetical protein
MLIPLVNWSSNAVHGLTVTLRVPAPLDSVSLATGGPVRVEKRGSETAFTLDVEVADAIVLRPGG